jgi:hypothetical protein
MADEDQDHRDSVESIDVMYRLHDEILLYHHERPSVALRALGRAVCEVACCMNKAAGMPEECPCRAVEEALEIVAAQAREVVAGCERELGEPL